MTSLRASRPSAGLLVSIIAPIVALGGTSSAAFTLPKNSVGTKQLKNGSVRIRRILLCAVVVLAGLAATNGVALAASGQAVCIGRPSQPMAAPNSHGKCRKGQALVRLATQGQVASLRAQLATVQKQVSAGTNANSVLAGQVSSLQTGNSTLKSEVSALQSDSSTLKGDVSALQSDNNTLKGEVSALQTTLSKVSFNPHGLNGLPTLQIAGANLQIISGSGATDGTVNGLGNVVIGYDEGAGKQTGSHNLVLGKYQTFSSYGGLVGGEGNTLSGPFSDGFGFGNTASGNESSVTGGDGNTASGTASSVSGGYIGSATDNESSVIGGDSNSASGSQSSVSGGYGNTASGQFSSILGGLFVTVSSSYGHSP